MDHMSLVDMLVVSVPEFILMTLLGFQLTGLKISPKQLFLATVIYLPPMYLIRAAPFPFGVHTVLITVVYITILVLITRYPVRAMAMAALIGMLVSAILQTIVIQTTLIFLGIGPQDIFENSSIRFLSFLPNIVIMSMLLFIARYRDFKLVDLSVRRGKVINHKFMFRGLKWSSFLAVAIPLGALAILGFIIIEYQDIGISNKMVSILIICFSVVMCGIIIFSMGTISLLKEREIQAKSAEETISHLDKIIKSIRKQRHDFNHHLQAIYGLLEVDSPEMAKDYVNQIFLDTSTPAEVVKTDNPNISALLYAKAGQAEAGGVNFRAEVECSLEGMPLKTVEASSLLGNLLDNAIEAAGNSAGKQPHVRVEMTLEGGRYIFTVANTWEGEPISLERMCESHYTTKEDGGGLGLSIVKEIVDKYSGKMDLSYLNNEIIITVEIPEKGERKIWST